MGLNREKITLLKYKLSEMIDNNKLVVPKIILMMSDLSLSYVDGLNLELLLDNITADRRVLRRNIKILSFDTFVRDFIDGHPVYEGVKVVKELSSVLNSLVEGNATSSVQELITDKILSVSDGADLGSVDLHFSADNGNSGEKDQIDAEKLKIAIVDMDLTVVKFLRDTVETLGDVSIFLSAKEFVSKVRPNQFDLVITGMYMPEVTGLDLLKYLIDQKIDLPVIVYSNVVQKEVIMQTLKLGASSYLVKPQPAEVIVQKALEVINAKR